MKRWLICLVVFTLLLPGLSACGGNNVSDTSNTPGAPAIAKVRMWLTLTADSNAAPVTTLTPEQTVQASIWARGTTEENITFKVNLVYNSKLTTIANNVRTEGSGKAVGIGGFASPLELGKYTFQAITGAFGSIIGSLDITIASASPPGTSSAPSGLLEQPDKVTFSKYFKDMGLGKIPIGGQLPQDLQQNVAVFTSGDLIALYGTVIQGASLCSIL